ncbi:MAG: SRPBCC family protein [Gemmatimonadota bacterium]
MATPTKRALRTVTGNGPAERLKDELRNLVSAAGDRALDAARERVSGAAGRLTDYAEHGGPGLMAAVTGAKDLAEGKSPARAMAGAGLSGLKSKVGSLFGGGKGGKGGKGKKNKVTNIIETIDVGAPVSLVYNQWTQFRDFPSFMKKVENVDQEADEKLHWKAQVFWSHREWNATITQQVPDRRIVWRSKGAKGSVDGAVTFHELAPELTRVVLVLEYHPQGLFEKTGNIWRAQGRRARLELKHFRRHVMTQAILRPDEIEGWRGEIQDGEVVRDHETALREEQQGGEPGEDESGDEGYAEDEDRAETRDRDEDEEIQDRDEEYEEEPEAEEPEEEPDEEPVGAGRGRSRRPAPARSRRARA